MRARLVAALVLLAGTARAERPVHGSVGIGGTFVFTGAEGDRLRYDITAELSPGTRLGGLVAWRAFDGDHRGLVMAGVTYEGAAARPRLVIALHAAAGADLDTKAPLVGAGLRATLAVIGPLGLVFDTGAYLVLDGVDDSRLQLQLALALAARW